MEKNPKYKPIKRGANATKEEVIEALIKEKGCVYNAIKDVGISSQTYYRWLEEDPEFAKDAEATQIIERDWVISKFAQLLEQGDPRSIQFYLKTKGGYVEQTKVEHKISTTDTVDVNLMLETIKEDISKETN